MLQYITNTECGRSVEEQVKAVLEGGCKWIQLRMKDASDDEMRRVYKAIMPMCGEKDAFIVINDRVHLAKELEASGVHLGKHDMLPAKARLELGPLAIIGCTANTFEDIEAVRALDIDYIGLGPFRYTQTKKNLAPTLGIEGLRDLKVLMENNQIEKATVAVGGIRTEDVEAIMSTGVNGIAVSGAIAFADDMAAKTREFLRLLTPFEPNASDAVKK